MTRLICITLLLPFSLSCQSIVQDALSSAGVHAELDGLNVDWVLGELAVETIRAEEINITQGFLQGEIAVSTSVLNPRPDLFVKVYPNPAQDIIFVEAPEVRNQKMILFDSKGELYLQGVIKDRETTIDMSFHPPGVYFLVILSGADIIQHSTIEIIR